MYYRSLNAYLRETFGCKVYKLALSAGCTCPNRDGTLDARGCIFCSGSGEFAASAALPVSEQLAQAKRLVAAKAGPDARYIAYFQDYSNTYAPADQLRPLFLAAIDRDEICALSIATRPDCLPPEILALLAELRAAGKTLAVAESCTGGLVAKRLTDIAGCSDVFLGGCVTYCNEAKMKLLGVKRETLDAHTAVSRETAAEMARGVRLALGADIGLATTGYAGPGGGTDTEPVGTVYVAISDADGERVRRLSMSPLRSREYIRYSAATQAMGQALTIPAPERD